MAEILKSGRTYTDVRGVVYSNAYMVIDRSTSQALPAPSVTFELNIYKDSASRTSGFQPIFSAAVSMNSTQVAAYLGTPKDTGSTEVPLAFIKKHIYTFLTTELPVVPSVVWDDWQSDGMIP